MKNHVVIKNRKERALLGGLHGELENMKDELEHMNDFVKRAGFLVENDSGLETWLRQVRDVAYDVEDILDEFMRRCTYSHSNGVRGLVQKLYNKTKKLKARHEIANEIQGIRKRIINISEAHKRYQTQYTSAAGPSYNGMRNVQYDKRGDALLLEESDLVGIEKSRKDLKELILSSDIHRNVISVVGMGGLGKTTLVKKVFDDINVKRQFNNHMWITVSDTFGLKDLIKDTYHKLLELKDPDHFRQDLDSVDINGLKQRVYELLQSEKYIVVFDDVWRQADWEAIHLAFPRNKCGSRVIITTRNYELAKAASNTENGGFIYRLEPLTDEEASQLLCKKVFGGSISCPPHLTHVFQKLLKACEGLPLAIEVIGSTLATKSRLTEEWDLFYRGLGEMSKTNKSVNVMMKLLFLSYYDLDDNLRVCLLYLSIFPEDAFIEKMTLIRLWIAEGFVEEAQGMSMEEVAEGYLYELLNRSLLQVAELYHDGRVRAVRVHDIVRHMIVLQAKEQNITSIISSKEGQSLPNKARRLAIHGIVDIGNMKLEKSICKSLRSVVLFQSTGHIPKQALHIMLFDGRRLIKVLDLRGVPLKMIPDELFGLVHLKYLSLRNTGIRSLPKSIGKLQNLETLNLKGTYVTELPGEIIKLQKLRHILVYRNLYREVSGLVRFALISSFRAPFKIGELKSLRKICFIDADETGNVRIVKELGKLTQLRRLGVMKLRRKDSKEFCFSLEKLTQLRSLSIVSYEVEEVIDLQYFLSPKLLFLRTLELWGRMENLPRWISSLRGLTYISLRWSNVRDDPLQYLHGLPSLVKLYLECVYEGSGLCFKAGGFPALKWLTLWSLEGLKQVKVEESSLPLLEEFKVGDCKSMIELPNGIQHLMHLQYLRFYDMSNSFVNAIENMDKESNEYQWILRLPRLVVSDMVGQRWNNRFLNRATGKFI